MVNEIECFNDDLIIQLTELQCIIATETGDNLTMEELIRFLKRAMNHNRFQIYLLKKQLAGEELSTEEALKQYLAETDINKILCSYRISQNVNEKNIENVRNHIEEQSKKLRKKYGKKSNK